MLSLEQVQLLESRVAKAIEFVQRVNDENAALSSERAALSAERASLQSKLESNQKRLDELEMLVMRFKEDQGRIEDGILAALNRLSQFEEAFESSLADSAKPNAAKAGTSAVKSSASSTEKTAPKKEAVPEKKKQESAQRVAEAVQRVAETPQEDFELDADPIGTDFELEDEDEKKDAELDIF